jgi:hypothetical protein
MASCTLVGASLDPLTGSDEGGGGSLDATVQQTCVDGHCTDTACPAGQITCDAKCIATTNDPLNCGSCKNACKAGEVCSGGRCSASCTDGQLNCGGACADLQTDAKNCGACGKVCGADDECFEGQCVIACKKQLNQPVTDPWGWSWDGLERAASPFSDANDVCGQFRARLPTPTELYRVSAVQSATVGQSIHTNPLWSLAPASPGVHVRIRLSDGVAVSDADTTKTNYRCVCPPPAPKTFTGTNCAGAPNTNACAPFGGEDGLHNIDTQDRAPVPKGAAVWECAESGGHLATAVQLMEAIGQDIGTGSGNFLHTADDTRNDESAFLNWTDPKGFAFSYNNSGPNSVSVDKTTQLRWFRCVGETTTTSLPAASGQWAGTRRNIDAADATPATMIDALDHCFKAGGHLPTMGELNELVLQGAPGGSDTFLWSADHTGSNGTNHTVATAKWKGIQTDHLYGGADMSWSYRTDSRPYRCVYFPIDAAYSGPLDSACEGGCTTITMPGNLGGKSWFDTHDRTAATALVAIETCRKQGGHLASPRDMTEAIRAGLPNGSNTYLLTGDLSIGQCGVTYGVCPTFNLFVALVKWTATMPTFDDLWVNSAASRADWGYSTDPRPYRCMWTNEFR